MATSPDFHFQPMFERGSDETEYRKITDAGVSTTEFDGQTILKVEASALSGTLKMSTDASLPEVLVYEKHVQPSRARRARRATGAIGASIRIKIVSRSWHRETHTCGFGPAVRHCLLEPVPLPLRARRVPSA